MANVRNKYIKELLEDKDTLLDEMKKSINSMVKATLTEEIVKDSYRQMLSEAEGDFEEKEVEDPTAKKDDEKDTKEGDVAVEVTDVPVESGEGAGDDVLDSIADLKNAEGEYDLTKLGKDEYCKVMSQIDAPNVRVVNVDGETLKLTDDDTGREYVISVPDVPEEETAVAPKDDVIFDIDVEDAPEEEPEFVLDIDDEKPTNESVGYTDNYQNKTAMTTPSNHEVANPNTTYSMDGGAPTGTEKPWAGKGDKAPYEENVSEGCGGGDYVAEEDLNETMTTQEDGPYNRGDGMIHTNTNDKAAKGRNSHAGGVQIHGTGENSYTNEKINRIMSKTKRLSEENESLKSLLPKIKSELVEMQVAQQAMAHYVKLITENATTQEEKQSFLNRFKAVKTREESKALYNTICEELKRDKTTTNVGNIINSQLAEAKTTSAQPLYVANDDLTRTLDFMARLNNIK